MHHSWIFGSMMATGLALFATVVWIQADRSAFTGGNRSAESDSIQMVISPAKPEELPPLLESNGSVWDDNPVMHLPPVEVFGRRPAAPRAAPAIPAAAPAAVPAAAPAPVEPRESIEPCSPWREIGPEHVDDGVPRGARRVRKLC